MLLKLLSILTVIKMTNCEYLEPDGPRNFSIRVKENFTGEDGLCIRVICFFTVPQSVSEPIRKIWFKGDPQNSTVENTMNNNEQRYPIEKDCSFMLNPLVRGESDGEYGLKLEWGQGKVHIFTQRVKITVKDLIKKPTIDVPLLTDGNKAKISCTFTMECVSLIDFEWTGIKTNEIRPNNHAVPGRSVHSSIMTFHPKPEHQDTKLTCTVIFQKRIRTEATVTLKVRYAPKILNSSHCSVWGDELTCTCVSRGVPTPHIYWPLLDGATKYCGAISTNNTVKTSSISFPSFRNTNGVIECVSENLIGTTKMEIQVRNHNETSKAVSWSLSTPWILFTLSVVLNIIIVSCFTVVLRRRNKHKKPKDDDHIYMTSLKREESVYETIKK